MNIPFLPNEILVKIMHSIPTLKDVLNCRLVCRHWNDLILRFGTKVETLYYNVACDTVKEFEGQNVIVQNKYLRRRNVKFLFNLMPRLKSIGIYGCSPRPMILDLIGDYFVHLQGLYISDTCLTEFNFIRLMENLPNLKILNFTRRIKDFETDFPTMNLTKGLQVASSLRSICLSGIFDLSDSFQFHESLEELDIDIDLISTDWSDVSRLNYEKLLGRCINLKRLAVYGFFPLLIILQNNFPKLEHFEWNKKDHSHDFIQEVQDYMEEIRAARTFNPLPSLNTLVIRFFDGMVNCGLNDVTEDELFYYYSYATCDMQMYLVSFLPNLKNLCLDSGCDLNVLMNKCPNIEKLHFNGSLTPKLEDSGCHCFGTFKNLKDLQVVSRYINVNSIPIIVNSCKNLERIYLEGFFTEKEAKSTLSDLCSQMKRRIIFEAEKDWFETFWRENWLNQFIDPFKGETRY